MKKKGKNGHFLIKIVKKGVFFVFFLIIFAKIRHFLMFFGNWRDFGSFWVIFGQQILTFLTYAINYVKIFIYDVIFERNDVIMIYFDPNTHEII